MDPGVSVQNQKTSQETHRSLQKFLEPERNPKVIYTDNTLEFGKACEDLSWNHCTSTPHRSAANGIAERAVRRVKEETSAVLLQSGLGNEWEADYIEYSRQTFWWENTLRKAVRNAFQRTNNSVWSDGRISPYFCERPLATASVWSVLPGKFLGCALYAGESGKETS